jgi:hypothetical protein
MANEEGYLPKQMFDVDKTGVSFTICSIHNWPSVTILVPSIYEHSIYEFMIQ